MDASSINTRLSVSQALTEEMRGQLRKRIEREYSLTPETAQEAVSGMEVFLQECADNPKAKFTPSEMVDKAWHAFILYTREYARFCQQVAGRFLHHSPALVTDVGRLDCEADPCNCTGDDD